MIDLSFFCALAISYISPALNYDALTRQKPERNALNVRLMRELCAVGNSITLVMLDEKTV